MLNIWISKYIPNIANQQLYTYPKYICVYFIYTIIGKLTEVMQQRVNQRLYNLYN